jgi:hypothetical protein
LILVFKGKKLITHIVTEVLEKNAIPGSWYAKIFRIQTMQRAVTIDFSTQTITKSEKKCTGIIFFFFQKSC